MHQFCFLHTEWMQLTRPVSETYWVYSKSLFCRVSKCLLGSPGLKIER